MDVRGDDIGEQKSLHCGTLRANDGNAQSRAFQHSRVIGAVSNGDDCRRSQFFNVIKLGFSLLPDRDQKRYEIQSVIYRFLSAVCIGSY